MNTQEKTGTIPERSSLVSNCTVTANAHISNLNVNSSVEAQPKGNSNEEDDDIKTPTVEELSFPGSMDGPQKSVSIYLLFL